LLQVAADFQPFYPTLLADVFATRWLSSSGDQLFILINRSGKDLSSQPLLQISAGVGSTVINCYSGETIIQKTATPDLAVSVSAEAAGFACVWVGCSDRSPSSVFLSAMSNLTKTPLANLSNTWIAAHTVAQAHVSTAIPKQQPAGMILVPGGVFNFTTNGIEIEGPDGFGVDFQFPWENITQRTHSSVLQMPPLWVDEFPVTNRQWHEYVQASAYVPADDTYYLAFWNKPDFNISGDDGYRPVTWVSPDEAGGTCTQCCAAVVIAHRHSHFSVLLIPRPKTPACLGVAIRGERTERRFSLPLGQCSSLFRLCAIAKLGCRPPSPRSC
jgi:gamma-glutamyl hercynylcysteine S-oxide synthase